MHFGGRRIANDGHPYLLLVGTDVTERNRILDKINRLARHDVLTGLANRGVFVEALETAIASTRRTGQGFAVLYMDLDHFKDVNDTLGHPMGDLLLQSVAQRLKAAVRETDTVARFGGDEFALILPDTGSPGARAVAERIRERIARHRFLAGDGLDIHLTASVGVATLPDVAIAADELVQAADAAMYRVKDRGKNGIQVAVSDR